MRLSCTGTVLVPCKVSPRAAVFRNVAADATPTPQVVRLSRGDGGPIHPRVAKTPHPGVTGEIVEVRAGELYELRVSLHPPIRQSRLRGAITIDTGVEKKPQMDIYVSATIPPAWSDLSE